MLSKIYLISTLLYKRLLTLNYFKMLIIQSFYIVTNIFKCLYYSIMDLAQTTYIMSLMVIVSNSNELSNGLRFYDKKTM